jgi:hypothetical protein
MTSSKQLVTMVPAAVAPGREGLELAVVQAREGGARRLVLESGTGVAALVLGAQDGEFIFAHGKAKLESVSREAGRAFVEAVAAWLGFELVDEEGVRPDEASSTLEMSWVRLGSGRDPLGVEWETFKLFLSLGERYAEVFLRCSADGTRAQLVEKWSEYREELVTILESVLAGAPARRVRQRSQRLAGPAGAPLYSTEGAMEFVVPSGWIASFRPEGHYRLTDPNDEMMIELSYLRLPPLPPEAPNLIQRLQFIVDGSEHARRASPIQTTTRDDIEFAWSEYHFDSKDTKRPEAAPRPARGRWLLAANDWTQSLVTGVWWVDDIAVAERAWNEVIASLHLAGRIVPELATRGDA